MVRQFLILAAAAMTLTAAANPRGTVAQAPLKGQVEAVKLSSNDIPVVRYDAKSHSLKGMPQSRAARIAAQNDSVPADTVPVIPSGKVQWKRPAGQFWGSGMDADSCNFYSFTPLMLRPWVDYTFEDTSVGMTGQPSWALDILVDPNTGEYETVTDEGKSVVMSYLQYERCPAPALSYGSGVPFPSLFYAKQLMGGSNGKVKVGVSENVKDIFGAPMPLCSHYYSLYTRDDVFPQGLTLVDGLGGYEGMAEDGGLAFGTNSWGYNAAANRFEKPESPYLLNCIYWHYMSTGAVPKDIPLTAYVFKTVDPASKYSNGQGGVVEGCELGDLIAISQSFVPADSVMNQGLVKFEFMEKDPVTGALSQISLEIEDDITIVVTGFDVDLGNGEAIASLMSLDSYDEGYGNLGYIGWLETDDKGLQYGLLSLNDMMGLPTVSGILIDASYPWIYSLDTAQPDDIKLPNEGETTEEVQGLDYRLLLISSAQTEDYEVTFDGEDECEWLSITDDFNQMLENNGQQIFTGVTGLQFTAEPNPTDENRTCKVKISIPAASYEITFRQGTNNTAVDVVVSDSDAVYYDLQGRRVANPGKGLYIKKTANKAEKVIL